MNIGNFFDGLRINAPQAIDEKHPHWNHCGKVKGYFYIFHVALCHGEAVAPVNRMIAF